MVLPRFACGVVVVLAFAVAGDARAIEDSLLRTAPAQSYVVYFLDAGPRGAAQPADPSQPLEFASFLIDRAHDFGLLSRLPDATKTLLNVIASLPLVLDHPHAVVLLDAQAEVRRGDSHRLGSLRLALVMHTRQDNARIEQRIQHLLKTYTNSEDSTLTSDAREDGVIYTLKDRRVADWITLSWGRMGEYYVATLGPHVLDSVAAAMRDSPARLAEEEWFQRSWSDVDGAQAAFAAHVRFDRLRQAGDEGLAAKIDAALREAGWAGAQRALWSIGHNEQAVRARCVLQRAGRRELQPITSEAPPGEGVRRAIPDEADWYALLHMPPKDLVLALSSGYLAVRSAHNRARISDYWRDVEARSGVSIERDLLVHLRQPWIIHNYPRHALNLPYVWTRMIPIEGDVAAFRSTLDRLLVTVRDTMDADSVTKLRRDDDGVWRLNFGLDGPALGLADRFLIISFSPHAVRQNVARLRAGSRP